MTSVIRICVWALPFIENISSEPLQMCRGVGVVRSLAWNRHLIVPALRCRPNLVEDLSHQSGLVLRQEPPVVLGDHFRGVLDGVARLLVGACDLEDMGRQHVADVVRSVRE